MSFTNQVVVITGASSGIGWALARVLAAQGARVGLVARRREQLQALADEIESAGGECAYARADVANREATLTAIQELRIRLGPVDLLIANAGVGRPTLLNPINIADVESMFQINVLGVVYAIEAVLPEMLERKSGHLAAMSSLASYKGLPGESAYCASKAAVNSYMEGLRIQLRDRGVSVTTLCPGFVKTPMTDINEFKMPFLLEADEAAKRIIRALERKKKVFNFPWQMSLLMRLTRWLPDWVVARTMSDYNEKPPFPEEKVQEIDAPANS
jgi:short-subunit dehydrogenase